MTDYEEYEVVVVGAGQAGLAVGYELLRRDVSFVILEAAQEIGESWRRRWDSLLLFTPARYSALPGVVFPGDPDHYPTKDEVADYLRDYVRIFDLPVEPARRVKRVTTSHGDFVIESDGQSYRSSAVVIASGSFQSPWVPSWSRDVSSGVVQVHASAYRNPVMLPPGLVLVVGDGDSGRQIAQDLSLSGRSVCLSHGKRRLYLPQHVLGRDVFWWLTKVGGPELDASTRRAHFIRKHEPVVGSSLRTLRAGGTAIVPRAVGAARDGVTLEGGQILSPAAIVWATGFRHDFSWIKIPAFDERGLPLHSHGVSSHPGLYFLGLRFQRRVGSALLGWVGDDASFIATSVDDLLKS